MADPTQSAQSSLPQFDVLRRRLQSDAQKAQQDQEDAIKRRYASQGLLNSGAYLKAQDEGAQQLQEAQAKGQEDISFQEQQELQRQKEIADARQYQTSEREASQQYATGERQDQQLFNKQLFDADMSFKQFVQGQNFSLAQQELDESKKANFSNFAIALKTAGFSDAELDNIFNKAGDIFNRLNTGGAPGSSGPTGSPNSSGSSGGQFYTPPKKQPGQTSVAEDIETLYQLGKSNPNGLTVQSGGSSYVVDPNAATLAVQNYSRTHSDTQAWLQSFKDKYGSLTAPSALITLAALGSQQRKPGSGVA